MGVKIKKPSFIRDILDTSSINLTVTAGVLSAAIIASAIPSPGNDKEIIFNKSGVLGSDTGFEFNYTKKALSIRSIQSIFVPDQTDFANSIFFGNGGASLVHTTGNEGQFNTSGGMGSLINITSGSFNTAFGARSGELIENSISNAMFGYGSLGSMSGGEQNTAIGTFSLLSGNNIKNCIGLGYLAGGFETASNKLFIDSFNRTNEITSRIESLVYGELNATPTFANQFFQINGILKINNPGSSDNLQAIRIPDQGFNAFYGTSIYGDGGTNISHTTGATGWWTTLVGIGAGASLTTGLGNTFSGSFSGNSVRTGNSNAGFGSNTLVDCVSGEFNLAIGTNSLLHALGSRNISVGINSLSALIGGNDNVGIGSYTLLATTASINCVAIGSYAGIAETGNNKLFIDSINRVTEAAGRTKSLIYGEFNAVVTSQLFRVNGNVETDSATGYYLGDQTVNGTWRIVRSGNDLVIERREAGVYVYKGGFVA